MRALSEAIGAPVVASDSPRGVADPALGAFAEVLAQTDLLVALGRPVDFTLRMGRPPFVDPEARFVLLDPEADSLAASTRAIGDADRIVMTEQVDCARLAAALESAGQGGGSGDWMEEVQTAVSFRPPDWEQLAGSQAGGLHALEVTRAIRAQYGDFQDAVLIMDGGEFGQWSQATLRGATPDYQRPGRFHRQCNPDGAGRQGGLSSIVGFGSAR